jgi:phenylacetate-CoA ligase
MPLALSTVLEEDAGLCNFQLVQKGRCDLLLCTGLRGAAADLALRRARHVLGAYLETQGAVGVHVHCRRGEAGRMGRTGKIQRVVAALP